LFFKKYFVKSDMSSKLTAVSNIDLVLHRKPGICETFDVST